MDDPVVCFSLCAHWYRRSKYVCMFVFVGGRECGDGNLVVVVVVLVVVIINGPCR